MVCALRPAGPCELVNDGDNFQEGQLDSFTIDQLPDVGPIEQVRCQLVQSYHDICQAKATKLKNLGGVGKSGAAQAVSDLQSTA